MAKHKMIVGVLLFEDFETLDVFGPVEVFGRVQDHYEVHFYSSTGGLIRNSHGVSIMSAMLENIYHGVDVFLIPGGFGTRKEAHNLALIKSIKQIASSSKFVLTVCTGSALLAKTGLLDERSATTNKLAFDWVKTQGEKVNWVRKARWTSDENYYTSAGVSAGIDMTLGFIKDLHGEELAKKTALEMEYYWNENKDQDNVIA